jgi:hypothetical protein
MAASRVQLVQCYDLVHEYQTFRGTSYLRSYIYFTCSSGKLTLHYQVTGYPVPEMHKLRNNETVLVSDQFLLLHI